MDNTTAALSKMTMPKASSPLNPNHPSYKSLDSDESPPASPVESDTSSTKRSKDDWGRVEFVAEGLASAPRWLRTTSDEFHEWLLKSIKPYIDHADRKDEMRIQNPSHYYVYHLKDREYELQKIKTIIYSRSLCQHHRPYRWTLLTEGKPVKTSYGHRYICITLPSVLPDFIVYDVLVFLGGHVVEFQWHPTPAPTTNCYVRFAVGTDEILQSLNLARENVPQLLTPSRIHTYDPKQYDVLKYLIRVRRGNGPAKHKHRHYEPGHSHQLLVLGDQLCLLVEDEDDYDHLLGTGVLEGSELGDWKAYPLWNPSFGSNKPRLATVEEVHPALEEMWWLQPYAFSKQGFGVEQSACRPEWSLLSITHAQYAATVKHHHPRKNSGHKRRASLPNPDGVVAGARAASTED